MGQGPQVVIGWKEGVWRGIITYRTLTQIFHNTWRKRFRPMGVFAVNGLLDLERIHYQKTLNICTHSKR